MYRNARTTNHMALTSDDIRCALKSLKMQDLPGYSDLCNHRYVCADKLYMGNRVIKRESKLKSTKDNWGRCKLSDIVYNDMGTLASPVPSLSVHWLSVKGTLPLVSSHFGVDVTDKLSRRAEEAVALIGDSSKMRKNENIENFSLTNNLLLKTRNNNIITRLSNAFTDSMNNSIARATNTANEPTTYIPRVEHVLEKVFELFYLGTPFFPKLCEKCYNASHRFGRHPYITIQEIGQSVTHIVNISGVGSAYART